MKKYFYIGFTILLIQACASSESVFELSPAQSMSITGLGPGQDAANNPYSNGTSLGIIENIGKNNFVVRVQDQGVIIELIKMNPAEVEEVVLLKGHRLYLDSELKGKAKVTFEKYGK